MVVMFNLDSFINASSVLQETGFTNRNIPRDFEGLTNEELFKYRKLFWSIKPKSYENLLFRLSSNSLSGIIQTEFIPPIIVPEDVSYFENFAIDLSTNEQLIVSANLYRGCWNYPLASLTYCNDSRILVLNENDISKINSYMDFYNIKAKRLG